MILRSVRIGTPVPFGPHGEPSAIDKQAVDGAVRLSIAGLVGDAQGDTKHHGGPEKALHHYPFDHYAAWRRDYPDLAARLATDGAFGENISTEGWTEPDVCIGDTFRMGTAMVQVSQGRQPCWRLNVRFAQPWMARAVQQTRRTGWYYRVLEEGDVGPGDAMHLIDRPVPAWPVSRVLDILYRDTLNVSALRDLAALEPLAQSWRDLATRRIVRGQVEDWEPRLAR